MTEFARLDEQADGYTELMRGNIVHAPLHEPQKLLDVGCGTGIVCRQMAQQYPSSTVYGVDISDVPPFNGTPANVEYITGDIKHVAESDDQRIGEGKLDYIYQRLLICGMTDWPGYIRQMIKLLNPGGYLEIHDYAEIWYKDRQYCSGDEQEDKNLSKDWGWQHEMRRGAKQLGLDLDVGLNAEKYMRDAGLVDVHVVKYHVPFGDWLVDEKPETRKIGKEQVRSMGKVFSESILPGVTRKLSIGEQEMKELKEQCRQTLSEEAGKYWLLYVVWGRKV
ncbi:MAG: hypothetical protein Q9191_002632 [Dirinaria sp. TL-2023a]